MKLTVIFLCWFLLCHDTGADLYGSLMDDLILEAASAVENARAVILNHTPFEDDHPLIGDIGTSSGETGDQMPLFDTVKDVSIDEANIEKEAVPKIITPIDNIIANTTETVKSTVVPSKNDTTEAKSDKPGDQDVSTKKPGVNTKSIEPVDLVTTVMPTTVSISANALTNTTKDGASPNNVNSNGTRNYGNVETVISTNIVEDRTPSRDLVTTAKSIEEANGNGATTLSSVNSTELGKANLNGTRHYGNVETGISTKVVEDTTPSTESVTTEKSIEGANGNGATTLSSVNSTELGKANLNETRNYGNVETGISAKIVEDTTPSTDSVTTDKSIDEANGNGATTLSSVNSTELGKANLNESRNDGNVETGISTKVVEDTTPSTDSVTTAKSIEEANGNGATTLSSVNSNEITSNGDAISTTEVTTPNKTEEDTKSTEPIATTTSATIDRSNNEGREDVVATYTDTSTDESAATVSYPNTTNSNETTNYEKATTETSDIARQATPSDQVGNSTTIPTDRLVTAANESPTGKITTSNPTYNGINLVTNEAANEIETTTNSDSTSESIRINTQELDNTGSNNNDPNNTVTIVITDSNLPTTTIVTSNLYTTTDSYILETTSEIVPDVNTGVLQLTTEKKFIEELSLTTDTLPDIAENNDTIKDHYSPTDITTNEITTSTKSSTINLSETPDVLSTPNPVEPTTMSTTIKPINYKPLDGINTGTPKIIFEEDTFTNVLIGDIPESTTGEDIPDYWTPIMIPPITPLKLPKFTTIIPVISPTTSNPKSTLPGISLHSNIEKKINPTEPATIVESAIDFKPLIVPVISSAALPNYTTIIPIESTTTTSQQVTSDSTTLSEFPLNSIDSPGPLLATLINSATKTLSPDATPSPPTDTSPPLAITTDPSSLKTSEPLTNTSSSPTIVTSTLQTPTTVTTPTTSISSTMTDDTAGVSSYPPTPLVETTTPLTTLSLPTTVRPTSTSITPLTPNPGTSEITTTTSLLPTSSIVTTSMKTETTTPDTPSSTVTSTTKRKPAKDYKLAVFINFLKPKSLNVT